MTQRVIFTTHAPIKELNEVTARPMLSEALNKYFGFKKFKGEQEQVMESLMAGVDTFVIMPTGGGKSLCYQLPALLSDGTALIISPLVALMKNQVDAIRGFGTDDSSHTSSIHLTKGAAEQVRADVQLEKPLLM